MGKKPPRAEQSAKWKLQVRLSPRERQIVAAAAKVNHQNSSDFARDALMSAAEDCMDLEDQDSLTP